MEPTTLLPVIAVLSLVSVEYGGWSLLGLITKPDQLGEFRERFFRAGHAYAGVLLVLSLIYFLYLDRTGFSDGTRWLAGIVLLVGILAHSGLAIADGPVAVRTSGCKKIVAMLTFSNETICRIRLQGGGKQGRAARSDRRGFGGRGVRH